MYSDHFQLYTLDNLNPGNQGFILGLAHDCPEGTRQLLMQYGFINGSWIVLQFKNQWGSLIAVEVRNSLIAIRSSEAKYIKVRRKYR